MAKKPDELTLANIQDYRDELQNEFDELEEKQSEKETDTRAQKMYDLQTRIDSCEAAIDAIESIE